MSSNPRKFSEKIALHNQKQAEETAAFERIMHEVSETRYGVQRIRTPINHLQPHSGYIGRNILGGSLPNVNQISVNPQMEMQQHIHFDDPKHPIIPRHQSRLESRPRPYDHRRISGLERSRGLNHFDNPPGRLGPSYLPLPTENSWRSSSLFHSNNRFTLSRTNSDSALHQSVMNPNSQDHYNSTGNQLHQVRKDLMDPSVNNSNYKTILDNKNYERQMQGGGRPKSCEAPTINIVQTTDHPNFFNSVNDHHNLTVINGCVTNLSSLTPGLPHTGQVTSNTGSLPDLTTIQFPSPLPNPLDPEEIHAQRHPNQMTMPNNIRPITTMPPSGLPSYINNLTRPPLSPGKPRRHTHNGPSPLIMDDAEHIRRMKYSNVSQKFNAVKNDLNNISFNYPYTNIVPQTNTHTILPTHNNHPRLPLPPTPANTRCHNNLISNPGTGAASIHTDVSVSSCVGTSPIFATNRISQQLPSPLTSPSPPASHCVVSQFSPATSPQQQHRNFVTTGTAVAGGGNNPILSSESYYCANITSSSSSSAAALQPLQHQLEQFHVVNDNPVVSTTPSHHHHSNYSLPRNNFSTIIDHPPVDTSSYLSFRGANQSTNHVVQQHKDVGRQYLSNKIPDITFTGVDDSFGRSCSSHAQSATGAELIEYQPGEELRVNMGLEGIHLLEDSSNIITDPVIVENTFPLN